MADVFRALADPTRRAIIDALVERDGQTLFELCSRLSMGSYKVSTRQAVSQHLDVLEDAGLVTVRREGRYKFHSLQLGPLETAVARWLDPGGAGRSARPSTPSPTRPLPPEEHP